MAKSFSRIVSVSAKIYFACGVHGKKNKNNKITKIKITTINMDEKLASTVADCLKLTVEGKAVLLKCCRLAKVKCVSNIIDLFMKITYARLSGESGLNVGWSPSRNEYIVTSSPDDIGDEDYESIIDVPINDQSNDLEEYDERVIRNLFTSYYLKHTVREGRVVEPSNLARMCRNSDSSTQVLSACWMDMLKINGVLSV